MPSVGCLTAEIVGSSAELDAFAKTLPLAIRWPLHGDIGNEDDLGSVSAPLSGGMSESPPRSSPICSAKMQPDGGAGAGKPVDGMAVRIVLSASGWRGTVAVKKRRSRQEKKRLSYSKDRRNWYGENDKSSRKNIARRKRARLRMDRRRARQQLAAAAGAVDERAGELAGERVASTRPGQWRKIPDVPLGVYVAGVLARRVRKGVSMESVERIRIENIRHNTVLDGTVHRDSRWSRFRWPG